MTQLIEQDCLDLEQGSPEWKAARMGYVTASNIGNVMAKGKGLTRRSYLLRLVSERLTGGAKEGYTSSAMEWGIEKEAEAMIAYELKNDILVDKTGFWKHPTIKWLGVSPDRLVGDMGLIECKCPNTETHLEYIFDDVVPVAYYKQIQCQLWVTGREWCDFVSFDPRLPSRNQLFVKRCFRSNDTIADMESETITFLDDVQAMVNILSGE